jgi:hypothetical protein
VSQPAPAPTPRPEAPRAAPVAAPAGANPAKAISLNQLKSNANHPPVKSAKHREDLRNALKEVMSLADQETKDSSKSPDKISSPESITPTPKPAPIVKEELTKDKPSDPTAESKPKEVPEAVLRKILAGGED